VKLGARETSRLREWGNEVGLLICHGGEEEKTTPGVRQERERRGWLRDNLEAPQKSIRQYLLQARGGSVRIASIILSAVGGGRGGGMDSFSLLLEMGGRGSVCRWRDQPI